ncbi:MAG: hypothetical protein JWO06_3297 [Bacteroidota bacterium]|nr:hypothetical protein [Bacteroidota bacterium]
MKKLATCAFLILLLSCHSKKTVQDTVAPTGPVVDILSDSLYAYKNMQGRFDFDSVKWNLVALDTFQKKILLKNSPFGGGIEIDCNAYFLSKGEKTGSIQPLTLVCTYDDYGAILLLNLNDKREVISWKELSGGVCAGPYEADTGLQLCPRTYSVIKAYNDFDFYALTETDLWTDSGPTDSLAIIESKKYRITIDTAGNIKQKMMDSIVYRKWPHK